MFFYRSRVSVRFLRLTGAEVSMIRKAMLQLRNRAIRENIPTEDIDSLLVRVHQCLIGKTIG